MAKDINYKIGADAEAALTELSKMNAKLTEQVAKLQDVDKAGKAAGSGVDSLVSKAAGFVSLAAVIGGVVKVLTAVDDRARHRPH